MFSPAKFEINKHIFEEKKDQKEMVLYLTSY